MGMWNRAMVRPPGELGVTRGRLGKRAETCSPNRSHDFDMYNTATLSQFLPAVKSGTSVVNKGCFS